MTDTTIRRPAFTEYLKWLASHVARKDLEKDTPEWDARAIENIARIGALLLVSLIAFGSLGIVGELMLAAAFLGYAEFRGRGMSGRRATAGTVAEVVVPEFGGDALAQAVSLAVFGRNDMAVEVVTPWTEVSPGSESIWCQVRLPRPHTAARGKSSASAIASALDLGVHQVRIETVRESARDVRIVVIASDPWTDATHLDPSGRVDVFDGVEIGTGVDGGPVSVQLVGRSFLIGGLPDAGKTTTGLTVLAQTMRDPHVRHWIADAKGPDTSYVRQIAHRSCKNSQRDFLDMLGELEAVGHRKVALVEAESKRRRTNGGTSVSSLDREMLATAEPGSPLWWVDVLYVDEARFYTDGSDSKLSNEINGQLARIVEMFRAVGVVVIIATQRPAVSAVPAELRDLIRVRICHATTTPQQSNTILGDGSAGQGYQSTAFDDTKPGVAWMRVLGKYSLIRSHLTTVDDTADILSFATEIRRVATPIPAAVRTAVAAMTDGVVPLVTIGEVVARSLRAVGVEAVDIGQWTFPDGMTVSSCRGYTLAMFERFGPTNDGEDA
jgi:hypothetical protein